MPKSKKPEVKIKFRTSPALRDRLDMDYVHKLPDKAKKYLEKFIAELYGEKFTYDHRDKVGTTPAKRKEIINNNYETKNDYFHVGVRITCDPTIIDIFPTKTQDIAPRKNKKVTAEVELIYFDETIGQTVTRYKTVKP